jgi:hypothetical protein
MQITSEFHVPERSDLEAHDPDEEKRPEDSDPEEDLGGHTHPVKEFVFFFGGHERGFYEEMR